MLLVKDKPLLVRNCGQLLTLRGPDRSRRGKEMEALGIIRRGALLVRGGLVSRIGSDDSVSRLPEARRAACVDAGGKVVLPGFVDSHTHALFAASRVDDYVARIGGATYEQIARAGGGIRASARLMRNAGERALADHLRRVIRLFLEHGTTALEVKSGYGLEIDQELKMLRVIRAAGGPMDLIATLLIHDVPSRFKHRRTHYLNLVRRQLIPQVAQEKLADYCDVFCDRGYFSVPETRHLLSVAASYGMGLKLHAEQMAHSGAAVMAAKLGSTSVDHLDHVTDADIKRLRGTGTIATLLPGSVLHLGTGKYPPARRLIQAGIPVALATNFNPGSSPTLNMQMILSLACSQMRLSPAEAITAATINGAYAVGRGDHLGSLEVGKQADLVVMDAADYREIPYFFGMNHCLTVVKKGRVVFSKLSAVSDQYPR
jgi:imidazolonepropionase